MAIRDQKKFWSLYGHFIWKIINGLSIQLFKKFSKWKRGFRCDKQVWEIIRCKFNSINFQLGMFWGTICRLHSKLGALRSKMESQKCTKVLINPSIHFSEYLNIIQSWSQNFIWLPTSCKNRLHIFSHKKMRPLFLRNTTHSSGCFYTVLRDSNCGRHQTHVSFRIGGNTARQCFVSFMWMSLKLVVRKLKKSEKY